MKRVLLAGLITALLLFCGNLALTQVDSDRTRAEEHGLALVGAKIYPSPTEDPITDGVVLIKDGKIVGVGKHGKIGIPADFEKINAGGMTLTAGFWNCHVHFAENKWQNAATIPPAELTQQLQDMLTRYGFTAVLDTGSVFENTRKIRQRIEAGEIPGPEIMSTGDILFPKGGLPPPMLVIATGMMPGAVVTELENRSRQSRSSIKNYLMESTRSRSMQQHGDLQRQDSQQHCRSKSCARSPLRLTRAASCSWLIRRTVMG